jgi:hypothetical protein
VFQQLLQMVPGLEERLMEGSDENVLHLAELVCCIFIGLTSGADLLCSSKRALQVRDPMIRKV